MRGLRSQVLEDSDPPFGNYRSNHHIARSEQASLWITITVILMCGLTSRFLTYCIKGALALFVLVSFSGYVC